MNVSRKNISVTGDLAKNKVLSFFTLISELTIAWLQLLYENWYFQVDKPLQLEIPVLVQSLKSSNVDLWPEQPLEPPSEDVITGLEFLVDLPIWSLVGQQDEKKSAAPLLSKWFNIRI